VLVAGAYVNRESKSFGPLASSFYILGSAVGFLEIASKKLRSSGSGFIMADLGALVNVSVLMACRSNKVREVEVSFDITDFRGFSNAVALVGRDLEDVWFCVGTVATKPTCPFLDLRPRRSKKRSHGSTPNLLQHRAKGRQELC
jgi:hypothetical protein